MKKKLGCRGLRKLNYEYCLKPDAFVDFLDNEEHERLQKYQQVHLNERNDLVRAQKAFKKDLQEAAQREVKRCLGGTVVIDDEYEHEEFMMLVQFAIDPGDHFVRAMDVDVKQLAEVLEVPIPDVLEEERLRAVEEKEYFIGGGDVIHRKLDAIIAHLGIEVPEGD